MQRITIFMDDSGVLCQNDAIVIYGGLVFTDQNNIDIFTRKYKKVISEIKCSHCWHSNGTCRNHCPEIKFTNTNKNAKHIRRIQNLLSQEHLFFTAVSNMRLYPEILASKKARGRYKDYAQKLMVKQICRTLIQETNIDPKQDVEIILNCDQDTSATSGLYSIEESIVEELRHGISNWNYGIRFDPIFMGEVKAVKHSCVSKNTYLIQAADFVAGSVRKDILTHRDAFLSKVKDKLYLP